MDDAVVSYLSAFLWSSVFVEERHTKVVFGIETFDMREFIIFPVVRVFLVAYLRSLELVLTPTYPTQQTQ